MWIRNHFSSYGLQFLGLLGIPLAVSAATENGRPSFFCFELPIPEDEDDPIRFSNAEES